MTIRISDWELTHQITKYQTTGCVWAEIGVHQAHNAEYIFKNFNIEKMYLIDPYIPYDAIAPEFMNTKELHQAHKEIAQKKLEPFKDRCVWLEDLSQNVLHLIDDESVDIVYVDGEHSHKATLLDMNNYYDKIKDGGLMVCYDWQEPEVKRATMDFCINKNIEFYYSIDKYQRARLCPPTHKFIYKKGEKMPFGHPTTAAAMEASDQLRPMPFQYDWLYAREYTKRMAG